MMWERPPPEARGSEGFNVSMSVRVRHAGGVRGDDGVYPARPSALYTPTGPLGRPWPPSTLKVNNHRCTDAADNHRSVCSD
ncbi:hypothetical protein THAOC_14558, partial [Thalassiosira oceanica]